MPGRVEQSTAKVSSKLTDDQKKVIEGRKKIQELVKSTALKPLPAEPLQRGTTKSDVATGLFGQRNVSTVAGKLIGHSLSDLPEKIRKKLPDDDRFVVHKSKSRDKVVYLEVKSADFKSSKWFEVLSGVVKAPKVVKEAPARELNAEGAPGVNAKQAALYAALGRALKNYEIPMPGNGKMDEFWKAIEEAALKPFDADHPEKGSRVRVVAQTLAAFALGAKPGISAERINLTALRIEGALVAEAHRNLHEGYRAWAGVNSAILDAVNASQTHNPGTATKVSDPYFRAEVEQLAGDHFDADTKLTVYGLDKNEESLKVRLTMIKGASESIDLAVWKIYGDVPGIELVTALVQKKKANPGMPIRVMVDGNVAERDPKSMALIGKMRAAGIEVQLWKDDFHPMSGMHWKALTVDAGTDHPQSIIGGRNVGIEYTENGRWRDTDVLYEGRGALSAYQDFAWLWNQSAGQADKGVKLARELSDADVRNAPIAASLRSETAVMSVVDVPGPDNKQDVAQVLVKAIRGAETEIVIEQGYFLDVPAIMSSLEEAARRGVKIRVFANSAESNDVKGLDVMGKAALSRLSKLPNVELYTKKSVHDDETGQPKNTLHSKFMTVDGTFGAVGSWNQHGRSMLLEAEGMVFFFDKAGVDQLNADFDADVKNDAYRETSTSLAMTGEEQKLVKLLELIGVAHM